jgi:hypothetical protein
LQRALQAAFFAEDFFTAALGYSIVASVPVCEFAKIAANSSSFQFGSLRALQHTKTWLGALDGVHDAGLAVARTFDGRITHCEDRFQIPLLRYVLECRSTTAEAIETMSRIPVQMVNDVMVLGVRGDHAPAGGTPYCWPDRRHWTL